MIGKVISVKKDELLYREQEECKLLANMSESLRIYQIKYKTIIIIWYECWKPI